MLSTIKTRVKNLKGLRDLVESARKCYRFYIFRKNGVIIPFASKLGHNTTIGTGTIINGPCFIASSNKAPVIIGRYCAIAYGLRIRPRNHYAGYANIQDKLQNRCGFPGLGAFKGAVDIGNNVWIADNVTILGGVTVGSGSILGAGAIITKDVPPFSVAVGIPAKVIKKRFSEEIIKQLLAIEWWNWSEEKIKRNKLLFSTDLSKWPDADLYTMLSD